jgi:hypothetical protein
MCLTSSLKADLAKSELANVIKVRQISTRAQRRGSVGGRGPVSLSGAGGP